LFVHGLGGVKENFFAAFLSPWLARCELVALDLPGSGQAEYSPEWALDVSGLAEIANDAAERLMPGPFTLAGASMGGLIAQLLIRRYGVGRIERLVSLEGNLSAEDCMFSRRVVPHSLEVFSDSVFDGMIGELRRSPFPGDHISSHNMALGIDVRAYHAYSFQTVAESDNRMLLQEFLELPIPRLFVYGSANAQLSYLPQLRAAGIAIAEVTNSAHFMFYDNPEMTFQAIGTFISAAAVGERSSWRQSIPE
jgi:pimeloyl-ACP methyl ester carboxylesterase